MPPKPDPCHDSKPRSLSVGFTVGSDTFSMTGAFSLAEFDHVLAKFAAQRGGADGLTPSQMADILARAEKLAKRLEGIDDATPNP